MGYLRRTTKKRNSVGKGELFVLPPVPSSPFSVRESFIYLALPNCGRMESSFVLFIDADIPDILSRVAQGIRGEIVVVCCLVDRRGS